MMSAAHRQSSMRIAIAVHGRFHAFDLARELLRRGHQVTLFTNYPAFVVERCGVPRKHVSSFLIHGIATRLAWYGHQKRLLRYPETWLHTMFGRWVAREIAREQWDVVHCWSGVSEEILRVLKESTTLTLLMRGSAHIRTQARLLEEEERRTEAAQDKPSPWIIAREQREYDLADLVLVLSSFARRSFLEEGIPEKKIAVLPLAVDVEAFRPSQDVIKARCQRILSGEPLRVLNVGTFSYRKGMWDMEAIIQQLKGSRFRFLGPVAPECKLLAEGLSFHADFIPKKPQNELPQYYVWGDVFLLPTIQDGYAMVLSQAAAAGLPILTTTNCAGRDIVREDVTGWVLPIRTPEAFIERLRWCDAHREELADMVRRIYNEFQPRDWADVAANFEAVCIDMLYGKRPTADRKQVSGDRPQITTESKQATDLIG